MNRPGATTILIPGKVYMDNVPGLRGDDSMRSMVGVPAGQPMDGIGSICLSHTTVISFDCRPYRMLEPYFQESDTIMWESSSLMTVQISRYRKAIWMEGAILLRRPRQTGRPRYIRYRH